MQNTTLSDNTNPENSNSYSASVPISLYREVTAELQAAQAMLDSLKTHNQQLVQQNQQLRREVETVVQVSQQLQQVVNSAQNVTQTGMPQMPSVKFNFSVEPEPPAPVTSRTSSAVPQPPQKVAFPFPLPEPTAPPMPDTLPEKLFAEVPETPYRIRSQPKKASDLSGLWLAIAIFLIVIAAFGAGYLVVRPLLKGK
ncbi:MULTISPECIES: hypothetical protein [unclassified Microcoleus]|uniref:hypothetical protein n=1 Tax=unclassified Microcoleus TaxID=2642155 RepID=UPI001DC150A7|nr:MULTISPECIES: hypothetical protein [unclassified Microcoleus]MCC3444578.1 hypothetical protein [Microcoleus sp. PH2017_03_ELD_O_A]MCC3501632.1 hypothetical protein [Microcoleus sp. PH2017_19_SFW_U_A]MCC3507668.1 hypothetical protein [Microcoleus sp. PH2017_17_BER_D_A]TAE16325.1 MAG: hypothetical protein EAZ94_02365 [Oscillatoriales cyanobacterium]MCC3499776.1 hypothetical protein [Microcoleus sp. PH2017_15_JOR_U_A]